MQKVEAPCESPFVRLHFRTVDNGSLRSIASRTTQRVAKNRGVRVQAYTATRNKGALKSESKTKKTKSVRRRGKHNTMTPADTARVVQECRYDEVPDVHFSAQTRMPAVDQVLPEERVVVQDTSSTDLRDDAETVAKLMCTETSADDPACQPRVSQRWITSAKRHINGITSRARSMRGNTDTPERVHRLLTEQEQRDLENGTAIPKAPVLPPHVEQARREAERTDAIARDVENGNTAELPELRAVSEQYAIGFMKHLEIGRNIDIDESGKYTFCSVDSALPKNLRGARDAPGRERPSSDATTTASASSSGAVGCAVDDDTIGGDADPAQPLADNIPILAQVSHKNTRRDANNSFQRAFADTSATLACKQSVYERLQQIDPRSTAGISRQSPLVKPFSKVLNITPQPFLYTAATDDIRAGMYSQGEEPYVHVDGDSVNQQSYDPANPRQVEEEMLNAYSHKDYYPIVPRISYELEQSFMRQPFAGEPRCINEEKCAGMTDLRDEIDGFVLVAFYRLTEIVETFIESNRAAYARYESNERRDPISTQYDNALRDSRAVSDPATRGDPERYAGRGANPNTRALKQSKCVLCHRAFANKFAMHLNALNATTPKDYALVPYCNITDAYGEYEKSACIFNASTRYRGLPGPIAVHNKNMYRQITVQSNGQTVYGLEQLHPRVDMDTTIHF